MVSIKTSPREAANLIQLVRVLTSNRRGRASNRTIGASQTLFDRIRQSAEDTVRDAIRTNQSDGPSLSQEWQSEKAASWAGRRWYASNNLTFQVSKPSWAQGPGHKNAWTGTLESALTSWYMTGGLVSGRNEVGVGYDQSAAGIFHPVRGVSILDLARWVHFGSRGVPARPFLNTPRVRREIMVNSTNIIRRGIINFITTGNV